MLVVDRRSHTSSHTTVSIPVQSKILSIDNHGRTTRACDVKDYFNEITFGIVTYLINSYSRIFIRCSLRTARVSMRCYVRHKYMIRRIRSVQYVQTMQNESSTRNDGPSTVCDGPSMHRFSCMNRASNFLNGPYKKLVGRSVKVL